MTRCNSCLSETDPGKMIQGVCVSCVFKQSETLSSGLSDAEKVVLREAVKAETEGLVPRELLEGVLERFYDVVLGVVPGREVSFDQALEEATLEIQRSFGLAVAKEMLKIAGSLHEAADEIESEIRRKIRALSGKGK